MATDPRGGGGPGASGPGDAGGPAPGVDVGPGGGDGAGPGGPGAGRITPGVDGRPEAFAVLLALALLFHVLWWHGPVVWSPWAAVAAAAAWLIARPSSVARLALLLTAAVVAIVAELPGLGSHLLLVLAVAACVLVHLVTGLARGRWRSDADALWPRVAPLLRAAVVVLYVAAVLSKLNDAYLDPATSPAGPLAGKVAWFAPVSFDGDWRATVAIWGSLLAEAVLPALLLVPRTRRAGLVLGLAFHGVLAASGTVPFTALMLALYVGFLPAGAGARRVADSKTRGGPMPRARGRGIVAATTLVVLWLAGALVGLDPGRVDGSVLATATRIVVLGASVAGIVLVVGRRISAAPRGGAAAVPGAAAAAPASSDPGSAPGDGTTRSGPSARGRDATRSGRPAPAGRLRGVFLAGTAALVLCAASPYLGWRAGDAFTMYSGLRTSPSGWNHALLPSAVRLRD